jgi:hypothetical protein
MEYRFLSPAEAREQLADSSRDLFAGTVHYHTARSHDVASRMMYRPETLAMKARSRGIRHAVAADHWSSRHPIPHYQGQGPHGAEPAVTIPGTTVTATENRYERPIEQEFVLASAAPAEEFARETRAFFYDPSLERLAFLRNTKGWLVVLPHPFENYDNAFRLTDTNARDYTRHVVNILRTLRPVVEINACVSPELNDLALYAAKRLGLPLIANSDTHIGNFNAYSLAPGKSFEEWSSNVMRGDQTYHVRHDLAFDDVVRETTTRVLDLFGDDLSPADLEAYTLTTKNAFVNAAIALIKQHRTIPGVRTAAGAASLLASPLCAWEHLGQQHRAARRIRLHLEQILDEHDAGVVNISSHRAA